MLCAPVLSGLVQLKRSASTGRFWFKARALNQPDPPMPTVAMVPSKNHWAQFTCEQPTPHGWCAGNPLAVALLPPSFRLHADTEYVLSHWLLAQNH